MQAILGAGGAIGTELAKALRIYSPDIRLVSRNPKRVGPDDQLFVADLRQADQVSAAVKGTEVVYLTAGLPYDYKVWQRDWPVIIKNVIDACITHHSRLVFFDNIYMYDGDNLNQIMETHRIDPSSRKGKVRAELIRIIWDAVKTRGLSALIARCADFYGPGVNNSVLGEMVIKPLKQGKTANWLVSDHYRHSFTYTVDAASATALLGNCPEAFGHTWHLPTAKNPPSGREWIEMVATELGVKPRKRIVGKTMTSLLGLFMPVMRESREMLYQYDKDYVFNSDKFEKRFAFQPTSYEDGIKEILRSEPPGLS
ncbi:NAD-dependent epimerase/dehydratase family protein [Arachidicoccus terrestris]|uniref:NAD-dependent epimerase/dehydratase family protein n=1 Tax=Arachidicoccus terrestris TaxID=2875539 RepID=UPI001CC5B77A|nr:NAD-dependent epimerase/dehydratase family protein [Arachidicoccus terrestris]UAY55574.1 NAD-dependent epimerase/dehydratase family protein [Arachidicoccus terrestris]